MFFIMMRHGTTAGWCFLTPQNLSGLLIEDMLISPYHDFNTIADVDLALVFELLMLLYLRTIFDRYQITLSHGIRYSAPDSTISPANTAL
jgi:hypothetical protein